MPNESDPEKKFKIRPRGLEKEKTPPKTAEDAGTQEAAPDVKKHKWENRLRQSGKKFPAKNIAKVPEDPQPASGEIKSADASSDKSEDSPSVEPVASVQSSGHEEKDSGSSPSNTGRPGHAGTIIPGRISPEVRQILFALVRVRVRLSYVMAVGVVLLFCFSMVFWDLGVGEGRKSVVREETKEQASVPPEFLAQIDTALEDLRAGDADKASKKLQELDRSNTQVSALTYLLALAAMQNGESELAEKKAEESIAKHERISDSLALQAVLETQKSGNPAIKTFGDSRLRSELLLRRAILADAANPFPMIELATLLRYQKRNDEALALLRAARSRLNPVDSHTVVDITIALSSLEETPTDRLPELSDPDKDFVSGFSVAYLAMRRGDFEKAAGILETIRQRMSPDLFFYLINDPALRRYAQEPPLKKLFQ